MSKITGINFFQAWCDVMNSRRKDLLSVWRNSKAFTGSIFMGENCVLNEVAAKLNLLCYTQDYYCLDSIFYKPEDRTPGLSENNYWFREIRVAFEHENNFKSGLYKEVSHLLITSCDLRVLVTYPNNDPAHELRYLHDVISGSRQADLLAEEDGFLIILGYENGFVWEGHIYKTQAWKKI